MNDSGTRRARIRGAATRRAGRFEEANLGTIFLDEIGELPASVQAKLLRVLQERSFQRLGGSAMIRSDFRLITATHWYLADDVRAGWFREDLFFRLAVFELELPPLRRRKEDIPVLAQVFIRQHRDTIHPRVTGMTPAALGLLLAHDWPGNVRESQNVIQRAMVIANGVEIDTVDLPERLRSAPGGRLETPAGGGASEARGERIGRDAGVEYWPYATLPDAAEVRLGRPHR